jgi:N-acetylglucosamine repressor
MLLTTDIKDLNISGNELKKYLQKKNILHLLYKYGSLSGPVICNRIGVSLPTALSLLNELVDLKLVEVRGAGVSSGGRKPTMFGLRKNSMFVIACELGRYMGKITIYNGNNQHVTPIVYFEATIDDTDLADKIYQNARELIAKYKVEEDKIYGIGLTMPGLIDEVKGINFTIENKDYRNVKERLEEKFDRLVYVNNDARMQAYGEYVFGAAKGYNNAIIVNWSWGIGVGMILDGKLYNGSTGFAGELSHIKVVEDGDLCICGKSGCLETVASANVLIKNAVKGIKSEKVSQLTEKFKDQINSLHPENIIDAAKSGDEFSISLLSQIGLALGKGLSFTIQLLNPNIIVLGGPISAAKQYVLIPIQQSLNKYCLEQIYSNTKIAVSKDWEQSGLLGITAMIFQKIFSDMLN